MNKNRLISSRIEESTPTEGVNLFSMKTGLSDAFTLRGSFLGGTFFADKENVCVPVVINALLDHGTRKKSKKVIRDQIEKRGANISFSPGIFRNSFVVTGLSKDISFLVGLLAEELSDPAFLVDDLALVKKQILTDLENEREDTESQARRLLSREIYPEGHPNRSHSLDELVELIKKVTLSQIKAFHKEHYGLGDFIIVATGDVNHKELEWMVKKSFSGWRTVKSGIPKIKPSTPKKYFEKSLFIAGKQNVDMFVGIPTGIDDKHKDYNALNLATFILGGNFSSRLMTHVRSEKGLTYHIYATLNGATDGRDGYFLIGGSFAPELFKQGKEATLLEVKKWVNVGINEAELNSKKQTVRNSFKVKMETTTALSSTILANAEDGRPTRYIDEYLDEIDRLTLKEVNSAIKKYIHPDKLVITSAGSIK